MDRETRWERLRSPVAAVFPIVEWARGYDRSWLRTDVVAGLTVAAAVIPEGMAYATLAGLPPETGLYASLLAVVTYLFVGTSRQVIYGPTSALAVLLATQVGSVAPAGAADYASLVALVGVLVFGVLNGVFVGVLVSVLVVLGRASYPQTAQLGRVDGSDEFSDVSRHPSNRLVRDVLEAADPDHPLCEMPVNRRVATVVDTWRSERE